MYNTNERQKVCAFSRIQTGRYDQLNSFPTECTIRNERHKVCDFMERQCGGKTRIVDTGVKTLIWNDAGMETMIWMDVSVETLIWMDAGIET